jgi:leucyl/phenylalanyl-tRNA---protein transferase
MKRKVVFPPIESANEDGLVAVGGDLELDTILEAYQRGIFPWPISTYPLNANLPNTWFSPDPRGVIDFSELHLSRSFVKFLKKKPYQVTFNQDFKTIIRQCAQAQRKNQPGTWITPQIIHAYEEMFNAGYAYSVEVWHDQNLVGGLYGVIIGSFISGESMFNLENNASKQGLYELIKHLKSKGLSWIDTQMVTEIVRQFGGGYIPRTQFVQRLKQVDWTRERSEIF